MTPNLEIPLPSSAARRHGSAIVAYEVVGFLAIIALSWTNELLGLPRLVFATDHLGGWQESLMETVIVLLVAIPVLVLSRRLVARLHYLEAFLRLCAWCRKIHMDGKWVPVEEFHVTHKGKSEWQSPHSRRPPVVAF